MRQWGWRKIARMAERPSGGAFLRDRGAREPGSSLLAVPRRISTPTHNDILIKPSYAPLDSLAANPAEIQS